MTQNTPKMTSSTRNCLLLLTVVVSLALGATCQDPHHHHQQQQWGQPMRRQRSPLAARRAADDSRPLARVPAHHLLARAQSRSDNEAAGDVVTGRFKAPAPEQVHQQRVPKGAQFGSHTLGASYRVADADAPEKLVHGIAGASTMNAQVTARRQPTSNSIQRTVSAKFQVSDEGLNYPPSKLSADIYGNVAEIVTAPPEAVESDFLLPNSRRFGASRP